MDHRYFSIKWRFYNKLLWRKYEGYFLEVGVQYLKKLPEIHNDLPFLPDRMKIEKSKSM